MTSENVALWIIVLQGFAVCYFEYAVWKLQYDRAKERKVWRDAKKKMALNKLKVVPDGTTKENSGQADGSLH